MQARIKMDSHKVKEIKPTVLFFQQRSSNQHNPKAYWHWLATERSFVRNHACHAHCVLLLNQKMSNTFNSVPNFFNQNYRSNATA